MKKDELYKDGKWDSLLSQTPFTVEKFKNDKHISSMDGIEIGKGTLSSDIMSFLMKTPRIFGRFTKDRSKPSPSPSPSSEEGSGRIGRGEIPHYSSINNKLGCELEQIIQ